jgi:hypothetical protein
MYLSGRYALLPGPDHSRSIEDCNHDSQSVTRLRITTIGELAPRYPWLCAAKPLGPVLVSELEAADDTTSRSSCGPQSLRRNANLILRSYMADYTLIRAPPIAIYFTGT